MNDKFERAVDSNIDQPLTILEDFILRINSLRNLGINNNDLVKDNTENIRDILIKAVGVAEQYGCPIPVNKADSDKEPNHLTFRMRKALDGLDDVLNRNYALISEQNQTINELRQLI